ncbi:MAG: hypothetical protein U1D67_02615 [Dehalococcoidia bacterium]|nr:hypothetical protein [Dehalococcoidia bacterium]
MNKRRRVAEQKHRHKLKKRVEKRKAELKGKTVVEAPKLEKKIVAPQVEAPNPEK